MSFNQSIENRGCKGSGYKAFCEIDVEMTVRCNVSNDTVDLSDGLVDRVIVRSQVIC